ncbi:MAG: site-specific DNA-methyltransferase [Deltaproteobacteria bacterium]|nr:site-specific DNA-methyltransferase [Deltaproteobacteria bacterium]
MEVNYATELGRAYCGNAEQLLRLLPKESVNLVFTSPPYALEFKKEYGNVAKSEYVSWFLKFARHIHTALANDGSFVLNIGGSYQAGSPTRSLYHFKLLLALCEEVGFHLAQELFWYNPAKLPAPAEWVNVRRIRVKDSVEYLWWFSKGSFPKANNKNVLKPYSPDMERLMERGYKAKLRPSGHNITNKFDTRHEGSIPSNLLEHGNNDSNGFYLKACREAGLKVHPARFPPALPNFFIKLLTNPSDLVLDPFAGSNTTGAVAEKLGRRWIAFELNEEYLKGSRFRFEPNKTGQPPREASPKNSAASNKSQLSFMIREEPPPLAKSPKTPAKRMAKHHRTVR